MIAELYGVSVNTINGHIKKIFSDGELEENSVIRYFRITASDAKKYNTLHDNLQMIIAVGFKVENERAIQFRKWASQILKDYTIQGWSMDVERIKKGHMFTDVYFVTKAGYYAVSKKCQSNDTDFYHYLIIVARQAMKEDALRVLKIFWNL